MPLWAIVPVKPLHLGKSRLGAILPEAARVQLMSQFLEHVLRTLARVTAVDNILVVSSDPAVHSQAQAHRAEVLAEPYPQGLNAAVLRAALYASGQQVESLLILPADLPLMQPDDVGMMVQTVRDGKRPLLAICPNQTYTGTNALLLHHAPATFQFHYGHGSFDYHIQEGRHHRMKLHIVEAHGLTFDLDTEEDWQSYQGLRQPTQIK